MDKHLGIIFQFWQFLNVVSVIISYTGSISIGLAGNLVWIFHHFFCHCKIQRCHVIIRSLVFSICIRVSYNRGKSLIQSVHAFIHYIILAVGRNSGIEKVYARLIIQIQSLFVDPVKFLSVCSDKLIQLCHVIRNSLGIHRGSCMSRITFIHCDLHQFVIGIFQVKLISIFTVCIYFYFKTVVCITTVIDGDLTIAGRNIQSQQIIAVCIFNG